MIAFFSGIFVPRLFIHPIGQQIVSLATPIWQITAIEKITDLQSFDWNSLQEILNYFGIQLLITLTYLSLSHIILQRRMQKAIYQ